MKDRNIDTTKNAQGQKGKDLSSENFNSKEDCGTSACNSGMNTKGDKRNPSELEDEDSAALYGGKKNKEGSRDTGVRQ